jgi:hypothetical protein
VRGEKQAILVASGGMLGRDDVEKASDGDFYIINHELTSIVPNGFEIVSRHHKRQIDLQVPGPLVDARRRRVGPTTRFEALERFRTAPELESRALACLPGSNQIIRIGRKKELVVLGDEHGAAAWACKLQLSAFG